MEILIFILPFIVAAFLFIFYREETVWWEYLVLILPSILVSIILEACVICSSMIDEEYNGSYVVKTRYEEPWNEYIHRTCYRTVRVGKHTRHIPYDCSYVKYHSESYSCTNNLNQERSLKKKDYQVIKNKIGKGQKTEFVDMNRHYYTLDGDAWDTKWNGKKESAYTLTTKGIYDNPFQANTKSLFQGKNITPEEADSLGLFNYPEIQRLDQRVVLGAWLRKDQVQELQWLNAWLGSRKNFRLYLLFFPGKSEEIAELQKNYWRRGNRREVICCIGLDNSGKVSWAKAFSWEEEPKVTIEIQNWFIHNPRNAGNLKKFCSYITPVIEKYWKPRDFSDFSYITIEITTGQYIFILIMTLIVNILISAWIITNEFKKR